MDLSFLSQAEAVMLEMEKAKRNLETAKTNFENAKKNYDEFLAKADDFGVPKAKLKKLIEDRIAMLFESGIIDFLETQDKPKMTKTVRKPKPTKDPAADEPSDVEVLTAVTEDRVESP
jgi:hypothetical protein